MSRKNNVTISICIPIYNGEKHLTTCLQSVINQTFDNFEVILVDDMSTDNSLEIAQKYTLLDSRFKLKKNSENLGLVGNWNRCIDLAEGKWIKFLFQDDYLEPTCIEEFSKFADNTYSLIACRRHIIFESVSKKTELSYKSFTENLSLDAIFEGKTSIPRSIFCKAVYDYLGHNFIGEPTAVMFRKDIISKHKSFNPKLIQLCDLEFWTRIASNYGLRYIPKNLATFRVHENATSAINKTNRNFRTVTIDRLILLNEYAYNDNYIYLRKTLKQAGMRKGSFENMITIEGIRAIRLAKKKLNMLSDLRESPLNELSKFIDKFPQIAQHEKKLRWLSYVAPIVSYRRGLINVLYNIFHQKNL